MISVLLVEDHRLMRDGIKNLLQQQSDINVVDIAANGRAAVEIAAKHLPDVVVMDIAMPELNGVEATRQIIKKARNTRILILTMHSDKTFVMAAAEAGASGYLLKDCSFDELLRAIRSLANGKTHFSSEVTGEIISEYLSGNKYTSASGRLSGREREVLQLLSEGKSTAQIAAILDLHERTVDVHRHKIMNKLNIHSVAELTKYAIREGLTAL